MDPSNKRVSTEGNIDGGKANNLQVVPYSDNKKVCCYCKREFKCGRGLGGHIKVHFKGPKMNKFSHKKKNNRRGIQSFEATTLKRENEVCGGQITDLSKFLVGSGWRVQQKRGSNKVRNERVVMESATSDDNHVECDSEDSCDEDDYKNIKLRKKLRTDGLTCTAHKICWTKRELTCTVCNEYFRTYHTAFCHANECGLINDVEEGDEVGEGPSTAEVVAEEHEGDAKDCANEYDKQEKGENAIGDKSDCNDGVVEEVSKKSGGGGFMYQEMLTSVTTDKMLHFDINEMPPNEED